MDFGSGAGRAAFLVVGMAGTSSDWVWSSATIGGVAMTLAGQTNDASAGAGSYITAVFYLASGVPSGSNTFVATATGAASDRQICGEMVVFQDPAASGASIAVTSQAPIAASPGSGSNSYTVTSTGPAATSIAMVLAHEIGGSAVATPTGTTSIASYDTFSGGSVHAFTAPGTSGSVALTWTSPGGANLPYQKYGFNITGSASSSGATATTLTGPSTGTVGVASSNFTSTLSPGGGTSSGVIITPSDGGGGGTFSPATVTLSTGTPSATFTYTAASAGAKTISVTNNGGLTNPGSLTYTASAGSAATALQASGPSSGTVGVASAAFTITANGTLAATKTITATDGAGGSFSFSGGNSLVSAGNVTCTYTPSTAGAKTITFGVADASLTAASLAYTAIAASVATGIIPFILVVGLDGKPMIGRI